MHRKETSHGKEKKGNITQKNSQLCRIKWTLLVCLFFLLSFMPTSEVLFPLCLSQHSYPQQYQGPFHTVALQPVVYKKCCIVGRPPSEGDNSLLPSHFSGGQWCLFKFNICRTPSTVPLLTTALAKSQNQTEWVSLPESRLPLCASIDFPSWTLALKALIRTQNSTSWGRRQERWGWDHRKSMAWTATGTETILLCNDGW